jgi:hypothetical protein
MACTVLQQGTVYPQQVRAQLVNRLALYFWCHGLQHCIRAGRVLSSCMYLITERSNLPVLRAGSGILPRVITSKGSPADQAKHASKTTWLPITADAKAAKDRQWQQHDSRQQRKQDLSAAHHSSCAPTDDHAVALPGASAASGHGPGRSSTSAKASTSPDAGDLRLLELPEPTFAGELPDDCSHRDVSVSMPTAPCCAGAGAVVISIVTTTVSVWTCCAGC